MPFSQNTPRNPGGHTHRPFKRYPPFKQLLGDESIELCVVVYFVSSLAS